jgi:hypothetical protein
MATPTYSGLSYTFYNGDGSTTNFGTLFNYIEESHITVTVDGVAQDQGTDYEVLNEAIVFTTAPPSGDEVRIRRVTPRQYSARAVDFKSFGAITETEMDLNQKQVWYLIQEALEEDDGGDINPNAEYLQWDATAGVWTAVRGGSNQRIANVEAPDTGTDAATKAYVDDIAEFGVAGVPQSWEFTGTGSTGDFTLTGGAYLNANYLVVAIEGVVQRPITDFNVIAGSANSTLSFGANFPANGTVISVQNFGKARFLNTLLLSENSVGSFEIKTDGVTAANLADDAVDTAALQDSAVTTAKINDLAVTEGKLADESVTFDKIKETGFITAPGGTFDRYLKVDKDTGAVSVSTALAADLSDWLTELGNVALNQIGVPTGALDLNNQRITNLLTPSVADDAATKDYVDTVVGAGTGSKIDLVYTALASGTSVGVNTAYNLWTGGAPSWYDSQYLFYTVVITDIRWGGDVSKYVYSEVSTNGSNYSWYYRFRTQRHNTTDHPTTISYKLYLPATSGQKISMTADQVGEASVNNISIYDIPDYHRFLFESPALSSDVRFIVYGHKI